VSTFHGSAERVEGLGVLPWSNTVHYSSEPDRREAYHRWLCDGMRPGYAADDGAALHFVDHNLAQVVASRPDARGYRVELQVGRVVTSRLATRYLGDGTLAAPVRPAAGAVPA
jgi:hypothetical protein